MNKRSFFFFLILLTTSSGLKAQQTPQTSGNMAGVRKMNISSSAFKNDSAIPKKYTCDGDNISPPLAWLSLPEDTKGIAIICEDPDAQNGTFIHWIIYNIPPNMAGIAPNKPTTQILPRGARQGVNGAGKYGYTGPCPPPGKIHHYHFTVLALDESLTLTGDVSREKLVAAVKGHMLGIGHLVGTYQKQ